MNKLSGSVSFSPQMFCFFFFFWYNRTDKWFMKMFVPGRMCLEPAISLLGTNTRANIGLGFFGNIFLTLNSDITLS